MSIGYNVLMQAYDEFFPGDIFNFLYNQRECFSFVESHETVYVYDHLWGDRFTYSHNGEVVCIQTIAAEDFTSVIKLTDYGKNLIVGMLKKYLDNL